MVEMLEPMGHEIVAYLRAGTEQIVARLAPQPLPAPGEALPLRMDLTKVHFFSTATEASLLDV